MSGGYTGKKGTTASMECLHLPTGLRSRFRQMNDKRRSHAMIAFNGEIVVFGGSSGINVLSSVEK